MTLKLSMENAMELFRTAVSTDSDLAEVALNDERAKEALLESFKGEVVLKMQEKFKERQSAKKSLELQWRLAIDFYNGNQFSEINPNTETIAAISPMSDWEERNVFNELASNIETRLAILAKRKNNMKVIPASSSSEDRTSAKIGNRILASTRRRLNMAELSQEANITAALTGTVIYKTRWDSSKGRVVGLKKYKVDYEDEQILNISDIEAELLGIEKDVVISKVHEGDVSTTLHTPFEIYPENLSVPLRDQRRVMHVVLMSPDEVFEKWGVIAEGKEYETCKVATTKRRDYGGGVSGRTYGEFLSVEKVDNMVRVYEEWELPTAHYPNGRLIVCTDDDLLHYGPLPQRTGEYGECELPFDVQQSLKTDGFFGKSIVDRMIPVQSNYNSLRNRKTDYVNRVTIGVLEAEEGSIPYIDDLRENGIYPGDIIEYQKGGRPPRFMEFPNLPAEIIDEERSLLDALDRMSGVSQLAKQSVTPTGMTSGLALAGLAEQDDTRLGLEAENIKQCLINVGKKWLKLYKENIKYPRMVYDLGKNKDEYETSEFIGNQLTSFDIMIEAEPESTDTLSQRRQKVIELLNSGLFNDTETGNITNEGRIKIFEMLELGDWESFTEADNDHRRRAARENNAMAVGDKSEILDFDDDIIHISVHNNFRLRPEYEEVKAKDPNIDVMFEEHVQQHLENLQSKNMSTGVEAGVPTGEEQDAGQLMQQGGLEVGEMQPSIMSGDEGAE